MFVWFRWLLNTPKRIFLSVQDWYYFFIHLHLRCPHLYVKGCFSSLWRLLFFCAMLPTFSFNWHAVEGENSVWINNKITFISTHLFFTCNITYGNSNWGHIYLSWCCFNTNVDEHKIPCYCILHIVEELVNSLHWTCIESCYCGVLFLPVQFCF